MFLSVIFFSDSWAEPRILVLKSHDSSPYEQTLAGFQNRLSDSELDPDYHIISFDSQDKENFLQDSLLSFPSQLVFTLGTPATQAILALPERPPIVAALIFSAAELRQQENVTAVVLAQPADIQWHYLRHLLPDAHDIAIIYNPEVSQMTFESLQKLAEKDNIELKAIRVSASKDLPAAIRHLSFQLDAFLVLDASVFNSAAVQQLLLFSFRNRIPLVGLSAHWVKAGALYALDWDYYDIGKQAAELALEILQRHKKTSALPPLHPRKVRPVYNPKTAGYMKLKLDTNGDTRLIEVMQ